MRLACASALSGSRPRVPAARRCPALASTLTQNLSWTIDRAGTTAKYRVVAYGDSIYAGYYGSISSVAKRAAPHVDGEYLSQLWNADIEVIRRTKSGAVARDIYNNKIVAERSYMQDGQHARRHLRDVRQRRPAGAQQLRGPDAAPATTRRSTTPLDNCTNYTQLAMQYINANAHANTKLKVVSNLYYPGYAADNALANCTDSGTGQRPNKQDMFLPRIAQMNWRACNFAAQNGFACADSFAQYMGADYDSNGDGQIDSDALRYVQGESRGRLRHQHHDHAPRDAARREHALRQRQHELRLHPVRQHAPDLHRRHDLRRLLRRLGLAARARPTTATRRSSAARTRSGTSFGHERMGWALSVFNPATP